MDELLAVELCQIVGGVARGVVLGDCSLLNGFCHLCQGEAFGPRGQRYHRIDYMTVASFIEINARQSPSAALRWLAPPLKGAFVEERNVCCLHRTQEPDEHLAHTFEQLR
jgi:hypothetical protein